MGDPGARKNIVRIMLIGSRLEEEERVTGGSQVDRETKRGQGSVTSEDEGGKEAERPGEERNF